MRHCDLTRTIPRTGEDEPGEVAQASNDYNAGLRNTFRDVAQGVRAIASPSTELSALAHQIAGSTANTSSRATTVAAAAEELSATSGSVASGMAQASDNLASVAEDIASVDQAAGQIARGTGQVTAAAEDRSRLAERLDGLVSRFKV